MSSGLASSVISASGEIIKVLFKALKISFNSDASSKEGVPPPRYMEAIFCPGNSSFLRLISARSAFTKRDFPDRFVEK
jgi:hypothetical protein